MVLCLIALTILAIMGIFSLKYRVLAKEAFRCMFRTVQLKPCDTGLDQRMKIGFTSKLMWWPSLARVVYKNFEIVSWIFVILMVGSTIATGYGFYNYVQYGNCNGPDSSAFCVFNAVGLHPSSDSSSPSCSTFGTQGGINASKVKSEGYPSIGSGNIIIHEYGCFSCPYTKEAEKVVKQVLDNYPNVKLVYHDVPLPIHNFSVEAGEAAICAGEQEKFWEYHDLLFKEQENLNAGSFVSLAKALDLNVDEFGTCLSSNSTQNEIARYKSEALDIGIYGTPTFFIGNISLVGPQSYKTFKDLIEKRANK